LSPHLQSSQEFRTSLEYPELVPPAEQYQGAVPQRSFSLILQGHDLQSLRKTSHQCSPSFAFYCFSL